jgi:hypothetical protein
MASQAAAVAVCGAAAATLGSHHASYRLEWLSTGLAACHAHSESFLCVGPGQHTVTAA